MRQKFRSPRRRISRNSPRSAATRSNSCNWLPERSGTAPRALEAAPITFLPPRLAEAAAAFSRWKTADRFPSMAPGPVRTTIRLTASAPPAFPGAGTSVVTPNEDSIKEIRIVTDNYDAENGRYRGGQVEIISQNGTNTPHGSFFLRAHRPGLDAFTRYNGYGNGNLRMQTTSMTTAELWALQS